MSRSAPERAKTPSKGCSRNTSPRYTGTQGRSKRAVGPSPEKKLRI